MKFLMDTDHLSIYQRQVGREYVTLSAHMALHPLSDIAISVVSFHEQVLGCHTFITRARSTAEVARGYTMLSRLLDDYSATQVATFDAAAGSAFDGLVSRRIRVGTLDLRIAAIALSRGLTVVTRNRRDFGQVPGLTTEDWTV